jgi:Domain of unknown function (DUF4190)
MSTEPGNDPGAPWFGRESGREPGGYPPPPGYGPATGGFAQPPGSYPPAPGSYLPAPGSYPPPYAGYPAQQNPAPVPYQLPYGYAPMPQPTNTLAILALVLAFVFAPAGVICGIIARKQIRESHEQGEGLALAGIIVGSILVALGVLYIVFVIVFFVGLAVSIPAHPA